MMEQNELLVNAYVILRYSDKHWNLKNYLGFPAKAFYQLLDEMIASDFTDYVISVYFASGRRFEKAVVEKGDSIKKELTNRTELRDWLLEKGGKEVAAIAEVYIW